MVHRKCYFLPAGWIKEVVVSNISSKPSIYGSCCISDSASRDRQQAPRDEVCLVVLASSLMRCCRSPQLSHGCETARIGDLDENNTKVCVNKTESGCRSDSWQQIGSQTTEPHLTGYHSRINTVTHVNASEYYRLVVIYKLWLLMSLSHISCKS